MVSAHRTFSEWCMATDIHSATGVTYATRLPSMSISATTQSSSLTLSSSVIVEYLNQPTVQKLIGVDPAVKNFTGYSDTVNRAFGRTLDSAFPTQYYIAALLERGVRVLVYVGSNDWICNWVSVRRPVRVRIELTMCCSSVATRR